MKYSFKFKPELNKNVRVAVFDQYSEYPVIFGSGTNPTEISTITINSLDYNNSNVFMMAKVESPRDPLFRLDFSF